MKEVHNGNKERVKEIYGGRCANWLQQPASHPPGVTIHHIVFKSDDVPIDKDEKSNLIPLCEACHGRVHRNGRK